MLNFNVNSKPIKNSIINNTITTSHISTFSEIPNTFRPYNEIYLVDRQTAGDGFNGHYISASPGAAFPANINGYFIQTISGENEFTEMTTPIAYPHDYVLHVGLASPTYSPQALFFKKTSNNSGDTFDTMFSEPITDINKYIKDNNLYTFDSNPARPSPPINCIDINTNNISTRMSNDINGFTTFITPYTANKRDFNDRYIRRPYIGFRAVANRPTNIIPWIRFYIDNTRELYVPLWALFGGTQHGIATPTSNEMDGAAWRISFKNRINFTTILQQCNYLIRRSQAGTTDSLLSFYTLDQIINTMNAIGIPWSFDLNEILNEEIENFTNYDPDYGKNDGEDNGSEDSGHGNFDDTNDPITISNPTISGVATFNTSYALTQGDLNLLSNQIWNAEPSWWESMLKLYNNPLEAVISLNMFPFDLAQFGLGNMQTIKIGNLSTTAVGRVIPSNYHAVIDMGQFEIKEFFGSNLDYSPNTKISLYLPFIGFTPLSTNEVMDKTLKVTYAADIMTGAFLAMVWADNAIIATHNGNFAVNIPISSNNFADLHSTMMLSMGIAAGGLVTAALAVKTGGASLIPKLIGGGTASMGGIARAIGANASESIGRGGQVSPYASLYAPRYCYLLFERPILHEPANYAKMQGRPSVKATKLKDVGGYVEVQEIVLSNLSATDNEKDTILKLLKEGVYIS